MVVDIEYTVIDGIHVFSSTEIGVYAASYDLREAYEDIPIQVKELLRFNFGIENDITPSFRLKMRKR